MPRPYTLTVGASSVGGFFVFFVFICIYFYFLTRFHSVPFRSVLAFTVTRCDKSMYLKKSLEIILNAHRQHSMPGLCYCSVMYCSQLN